MRKSCMKRKNSHNNRRKGSGGSKQSNCSMSAAEEASGSSLRLMMLQEESEFHLFRHQQTAAGKEQRAAKRERMMQLLSMNPHSIENRQTHSHHHYQHLPVTRRSSEPDLLRCSVRIISNAPSLSWEEYRRKRSRYIRSVFFCSDDNLCARTQHLDRILFTDGESAVNKDGRIPAFNGGGGHRDKSPVSRKSSLTAPSTINDYYQTFNNRLNLKLQQLDFKSNRSSPSSSGRSSSTASNSRRLSHSRSTYQASYQQIHEECCECAYRPLSQTVTLVKVPDTMAGRTGQAQWRACMVSGRDSLSCSLNSP